MMIPHDDLVQGLPLASGEIELHGTRPHVVAVLGQGICRSMANPKANDSMTGSSSSTSGSRKRRPVTLPCMWIAIGRCADRHEGQQAAQATIATSSGTDRDAGRCGSRNGTSSGDE